VNFGAIRFSICFNQILILIEKRFSSANKREKMDRYVPLSDFLARGLKKYFGKEHPEKYVFNSQVTNDGLSGGSTLQKVEMKSCLASTILHEFV
jgi:hypothetical protein